MEVAPSVETELDFRCLGVAREKAVPAQSAVLVARFWPKQVNVEKAIDRGSNPRSEIAANIGGFLLGFYTYFLLSILNCIILNHRKQNLTRGEPERNPRNPTTKWITGLRTPKSFQSELRTPKSTGLLRSTYSTRRSRQVLRPLVQKAPSRHRFQSRKSFPRRARTPGDSWRCPRTQRRRRTETSWSTVTDVTGLGLTGGHGVDQGRTTKECGLIALAQAADLPPNQRTCNVG